MLKIAITFEGGIFFDKLEPKDFIKMGDLVVLRTQEISILRAYDYEIDIEFRNSVLKNTKPYVEIKLNELPPVFTKVYQGYIPGVKNGLLGLLRNKVSWSVRTFINEYQLGEVELRHLLPSLSPS